MVEESFKLFVICGTDSARDRPHAIALEVRKLSEQLVV